MFIVTHLAIMKDDHNNYVIHEMGLGESVGIFIEYLSDIYRSSGDNKFGSIRPSVCLSVCPSVCLSVNPLTPDPFDLCCFDRLPICGRSPF